MSEVAPPGADHVSAVYPYDWQLPSYDPSRQRTVHVKDCIEPGFSLIQQIEHRHGPFLEIGGPSEHGYYHLDGVILPKRVLITNLDNPNYPQSHREYLLDNTDLEIDGTDTTLPSNSIGMVLSKSLPRTEWRNDEEARLAYGARAIRAASEAANKGYVTRDTLKASLRLRVAAEVFRILEPGGLYITDGRTEEIAAIETMGFTLPKYATEDTRGYPYVHAVFQKHD